MTAGGLHMREAEFDPKNHPESLNGAAVIVDPTAMDDLVKRLHDYDVRLVLAYNKPRQQFELWRREYDDQYRRILRSRPGMAFPNNLIETLHDLDGRRAEGELTARLAREAAAAERAEDRHFHETQGPAIEKLAWAIRKDLGVGKQTFAVGA